ncbi:uncharacterized protein LOC130808372 [Amaranthus tricolor]|uniref:uncharacterized protein LOC130801148 n=1 Tax=Amaranthus tricolor TaxID=29722 RepID=UPI002583923B|nr:uncharacterized protein LOC130801148 [Amaranthus tricolor]XP_057529834.1 uncharacterized protein LOC130808372 [Amaranthus tricolor]
MKSGYLDILRCVVTKFHHTWSWFGRVFNSKHFILISEFGCLVLICLLSCAHINITSSCCGVFGVMCRKHARRGSRIEDNSFSKKGRLNHIGSDLGSLAISGRMDVCCSTICTCISQVILILHLVIHPWILNVMRAKTARKGGMSRANPHTLGDMKDKNGISILGSFHQDLNCLLSITGRPKEMELKVECSADSAAK